MSWRGSGRFALRHVVVCPQASSAQSSLCLPGLGERSPHLHRTRRDRGFKASVVLTSSRVLAVLPACQDHLEHPATIGAPAFEHRQRFGWDPTSPAFRERAAVIIAYSPSSASLCQCKRAWREGEVQLAKRACRIMMTGKAPACRSRNGRTSRLTLIESYGRKTSTSTRCVHAQAAASAMCCA